MIYRTERCNAEGFGKPEPFFFPCEGRTYSPPRRSKLHIVRFRLKPKAHSLRRFSFPHQAGFAGPLCGGGMPAATCAPRGRFRFLRKATDNSASSADAASSSAQTPIILGVCLRKTATGSFITVMDGAYCPSIFFFGKETKTGARRFSVHRKGR